MYRFPALLLFLSKCLIKTKNRIVELYLNRRKNMPRIAPMTDLKNVKFYLEKILEIEKKLLVITAILTFNTSGIHFCIFE